MRSPLRAGRASRMDTLRVVASVIAPTIAQGAVLRRPQMMALAERFDADRRAGRVLRAVRERYGPDPLSLRIPGRSVALVLSGLDVARILHESPETFSASTVEKRAALRHFQPDGVLITPSPLRDARRRLNEQVLDTPHRLHRSAEVIMRKAREEAEFLSVAANNTGRLTWDTYTEAFNRLVRRIVLGDAARNDRRVTALLTGLRADANWAYLRPRRHAVRRRFFHRLRRYYDIAEPHSLIGALAGADAEPGTAPLGQVPHWMFAFDAAGIAAYRTLALLDRHPDALARVRDEIAAGDVDLAFLRACVLESVRLWPTTLVVLRDSTRSTQWDTRHFPEQTSFVIVSSFFHREDQSPSRADLFTPEIWLDGDPGYQRGLIPFSAGPVRCPGENLVLFVTSTLVAAMVERSEFRLVGKSIMDIEGHLLRTVNHTSQTFAVSARQLTPADLQRTDSHDVTP